jgi:hypothetical protein
MPIFYDDLDRFGPSNAAPLSPDWLKRTLSGNGGPLTAVPPSALDPFSSGMTPIANANPRPSQISDTAPQPNAVTFAGLEPSPPGPPDPFVSSAGNALPASTVKSPDLFQHSALGSLPQGIAPAPSPRVTDTSSFTQPAPPTPQDPVTFTIRSPSPLPRNISPAPDPLPPSVDASTVPNFDRGFRSIEQHPDGRLFARYPNHGGPDLLEELRIVTDPRTGDRHAVDGEGIAWVNLGPDALLLNEQNVAHAMQFAVDRRAEHDAAKHALTHLAARQSQLASEAAELTHDPNPSDELRIRKAAIATEMQRLQREQATRAEERRLKGRDAFQATDLLLKLKKEAATVLQQHLQEQPTVALAFLEARTGDRFAARQTYRRESPQRLTASQFVQLVLSGDEILDRETLDEDTTGEALSKLGLTPERIRGRVRDGEISEEQGRDLQERYYGTSRASHPQMLPSEEGFARWLRDRQLAAQYAHASSGAFQDVATVKDLRNRYVNDLAAAHSSSIDFDWQDFDNSREPFVNEPIHWTSSAADTIGGTVSDVTASGLGMSSQLVSRGTRAAAESTGLPQLLKATTGKDVLDNELTMTDDEQALSAEGTVEWLRNFNRNRKRLFSAPEASAFRDDLAELKAGIREGWPDEKLQALSQRLAQHASQLFQDGAGSEDTPDQYDVTREPVLAELLEGYRITGDPAFWSELETRLATSVKGRRLKDRLLAYITDNGRRAPDSWVAKYLNARVAGAQEIIAEIGLTYLTAGALKFLRGAAGRLAKWGVPGAARTVRAFDAAGRFARRVGGAAKARWERLGIISETGARPLSRLARAWNATIKFGKHATEEIVPESVEELETALGDENANLQSLASSAGSGALGAPVGKVIHAPLKLVGAAVDRIRARRQSTQTTTAASAATTASTPTAGVADHSPTNEPVAGISDSTPTPDSDRRTDSPPSSQSIRSTTATEQQTLPEADAPVSDSEDLPQHQSPSALPPSDTAGLPAEPGAALADSVPQRGSTPNPPDSQLAPRSIPPVQDPLSPVERHLVDQVDRGVPLPVAARSAHLSEEGATYAYKIGKAKLNRLSQDRGLTPTNGIPRQGRVLPGETPSLSPTPPATRTTHSSEGENAESDAVPNHTTLNLPISDTTSLSNIGARDQTALRSLIHESLTTDQTRRSLAALRTKLKKGSTPRGLEVTYDDQGHFTLLIDETRLMEVIATQDKRLWKTILQSAFSHEIKHLAALEAIRRRWLARKSSTSRRASGSFVDAVHREYQLIADYMEKKFFQNRRTNQRMSMAKFVREANGDPHLSGPKLALEGMAQLVQMARDGATIEGYLRRFVERIRSVLRQFIGNRKSWSPALKQAYDETNQVLDEIEYREFERNHPVTHAFGPPRLGRSTSANYRQTFFSSTPAAHPRSIVHHSIEQQVLKHYPKVVTTSQLHSLENLRGILRKFNRSIHLNEIRKDWDRFYRTHISASPLQLLNYARLLDRKYQNYFQFPGPKASRTRRTRKGD